MTWVEDILVVAWTAGECVWQISAVSNIFFCEGATGRLSRPLDHNHATISVLQRRSLCQYPFQTALYWLKKGLGKKVEQVKQSSDV